MVEGGSHMVLWVDWAQPGGSHPGFSCVWHLGWHIDSWNSRGLQTYYSCAASTLGSSQQSNLTAAGLHRGRLRTPRDSGGRRHVFPRRPRTVGQGRFPGLPRLKRLSRLKEGSCPGEVTARRQRCLSLMEWC